MSSRPLATLVLALSALALAAPAPAADWPRYRGPGGDGRSGETGLVRGWGGDGPRVLWRLPLGEGYSGMAVAGGRVYTMFASGGDEFALCVDAATGKERWRFRTDANRFDDMGSGPRSTPTVDGSLVYVLGAQGKLYALEAANGRKVWSVDLVADLGGRVPRWGVSASPLVDGDLLLVDAGGRGGKSVVALDKRTGKQRWAASDDVAGYSTPLIVSIGGLRQALFFTGTQLVAVDPANGKVFWRKPWRTEYDVNAAMPVFIPPDKVFISSSYDTGATVLRVTRQGQGAAAEEVWRSRVMKNHFNSSVLHGEYLYGFDDGTLKCVHAATGETKWAERGFAKGSLLYADGQLVILSERGLLVLVEATPQAYRERARSQVLQGKTWTMPSLADGRLFLRTERELVALDFKA
jgi:outer membrane protein assembly factor BamB